MHSIDALFPDEAACFDYLIQKRFGSVPRCPHCGNETAFFKISIRYLRCTICQKHVVPTSGTIFFRSKISFKAWFQCIFLMCISRSGISTRFVSRFLDVEKDTAWRMLCLIRFQMATLANDRVFGGIGQRVEIDETLLKNIRTRSNKGPQRVTVFGISDGKYVWTCKVRNRSRMELQPLIQRRVKRGSMIDTDGFRTYANLRELGYDHRVANHSAGFWVGRDGANTLHIDSYWAYLKRTLARTYVCVEGDNLELYLKEVEVRFNYRDDPARLFWDIISRHPPYAGTLSLNGT